MWFMKMRSLFSLSMLTLLITASLFTIDVTHAQTAYVVIHVHNPEGVEINTIQGLGPHSVHVYCRDDPYFNGYAAYDQATHGLPFSISPGNHTIGVYFNGMTIEKNISITAGETIPLFFTFQRTEIPPNRFFSGGTLYEWEWDDEGNIIAWARFFNPVVTVGYTGFLVWFTQLLDCRNLGVFFWPHPNVVYAEPSIDYLFWAFRSDMTDVPGENNGIFVLVIEGDWQCGAFAFSSVPYDLTGTGVRDEEEYDPPIARLSCSPTTPVIHEEITLDASASYDSDGSITSYLFDFGDGSSSGWVTSSTLKHAYTIAGEYSARALVKDNDGLMSIWSDPVVIDVRGDFEISAVWKNEIDNMIVPYDTVEIEFSFKSNLDSTLHDVVISYRPTTDVISSFGIPMQPVGTVGPYQQFTLSNNITVAGVDNTEIYSTIIVSNGEIDLSESLSIGITYELTGVPRVFSGEVTPTDEDNVALSIQYPDYQKCPGFNNPSPMNAYYLEGDADFHHPNDELVRKYAVVASAYPQGAFPDAPTQILDNLYYFIDGLFASASIATIDNDLEITKKLEGGFLIPGREKIEHICISQAYFFGSLARTIGLPARELNIALGIGIHEDDRYTQEAAIQVWYEDSWHLYDTYDGFEHIKQLEDYRPRHSCLAWAAFDRRSSLVRPRLPSLYGHEFLIGWRSIGDPYLESPDQWELIYRSTSDGLIISLGSPVTMLLVDPEGRRTGTTSEDTIVNEIPYSIYFPPGSYGCLEAGNPDSVFEIDGVIFIQDFAEGDYELTVTGTGVGSYTITVALVSEQIIVESANFTGETSPGERMLFTILASENELSAISWDHVFTDEKRSTTLRISTDDRYFQFIAPGKDFGVKYDPNMNVLKRVIIIHYDDTEMRLIATAIDDRIDFCSAICWDKQTHGSYLLLDKPDWRGYLK
jgi:hypothetical protein